jgi:hypothetical protein
MNYLKIILMSIFASSLFNFHAGAQTTTNLPPTVIENFELQTDTLIVRGVTQIGTVAVSGGTLFVRANEANDITHSQKVYGIMIGFNGTLPEAGSGKTSVMVDYDELDALTNAVSYACTVTWGVTELNSFEAIFTTKSGFNIIARSDRRQGQVYAFIQFADLPRIPVTADQLTQFKNLVTQAKGTLDSLK